MHDKTMSGAYIDDSIKNMYRSSDGEEPVLRIPFRIAGDAAAVRVPAIKEPSLKLNKEFLSS